MREHKHVRYIKPDILHLALLQARQRACDTSAAMALCPRSSPSTMPAASASTFFSAPQISTPVTSVVVLTRMYGLANSCCISRASLESCAAPAPLA